MEERKNATKKGNQSINHCFDILEMLIDSDQPLSLNDIAQKLEMSVSSVHSLLHTMIKRGYVDHLGPRQGYVLGPSLMNLCMTLSIESQLASIANPVILQLREDCDNETSYLGFFTNFSVNTIILHKSPKLLGLGSSPIRSGGLHASSMGKCMLAFMSPREYKKWRDMTPVLPAFTPNTITSHEELEAELAVIREQGYAENRAENEEGVYTLACPIFNSVGKAIASAAIGIPEVRYTEEKKQQFIAAVMKHADFISKQIGYYENIG